MHDAARMTVLQTCRPMKDLRKQDSSSNVDAHLEEYTQMPTCCRGGGNVYTDTHH
jgi:hypothetical protein